MCYNECMNKAHTTYQLRAYTTKQGFQRLSQVLDMTRSLYNAGLENRIGAYKQAKKSISFYDQVQELTQLRKEEYAWKELSVQISRGTLRRLDRAYNSFFRRVRNKENPGFPRFKSYLGWNTLEVAETTISMVKKFSKGYFVKIKGIPNLHLKSNRELPDSSKLKAMTITLRGRKIKVNLTYEVEKEDLSKTGKSIGIDVGVVNQVTYSDGTKLYGVKTDDTRKKRLQRKLSRAIKGSNNRKKKRTILNNECEKIKIQGRNATHCLTTKLIKENDFIAVEKLNIPTMTRKGRGKYKKALNREIANNQWGLIFQQLRYKAEWAGREFVEVDPKYTSQICSRCETRNSGKTPNRVYVCKTCGLMLDRDENAAINILRRGLSSAGARIKPRRTVECI